MRKITLFLVLISRISFSQINSGFEIWDTTFTHTYATNLSAMGVINPTGGIVNSWKEEFSAGVCRTTESHSGNYALILHNWYGYNYSTLRYDRPINIRPTSLQGYFKYLTNEPGGTAGGEATVALTHYNGQSNDTVATGIYYFNAANSYTSFIVPLNYRSQAAPDSVHIWILNGYLPTTTSVGNFLYLDDLVLTSDPVGIKKETIHDAINIFHNPATGRLYLRHNLKLSSRICIYDIDGKMLSDQQLGDSPFEINLESYPDGIYFYRLSEKDQVIYTGKIMRLR